MVVLLLMTAVRGDPVGETNAVLNLPRGVVWLVDDAEETVTDEELMRLPPVDPALSSPLRRTRCLARAFPDRVDSWRSHEPTNIRDPGPDTANFPNSPYTLPRGGIYLETTPMVWTGASRPRQPASWNWEYLLRLGVTDRFEFRLFSNGLTASQANYGQQAFVGIAPLILDAKVHLWGEKPEYILPGAGIELYVQTDWASPQLQSGTQPGVALLFSNSLPWDIELEWNIGLGSTNGPQSGSIIYQETLQFSFTKPITDDFQIFVQGLVNGSSLPRFASSTVLGGGFVRYIGRRTVLFASYNAGVETGGPPAVIQVGGAAAF